MASLQLNKQSKRDFCDHLANKLFKPELEVLKKEIEGMGELAQSLIASPKQIEAAAELSEHMVLMGLKLGINMSINCGEGNVAFNYVEIPLPGPTPMPRETYAPRSQKLEIDAGLVNSGKWQPPEWVRPESRKALDSLLVPAVLRYCEKLSELRHFHRNLHRRMEHVRTLTKLRELAPELCDEWVAYFGKDAKLPPALRFDDVLKVLRKKQAESKEAV